MHQILNGLKRIDDIAMFSERASSKHWIWLAAVIGVLPFVMSFGLQVGGHHHLSGWLLALLCLGFVRKDLWMRALLCIVITFGSHSLAVMTATHINPERTSAILPEANDYWLKQQVWINTGKDPEYQISYWVKAHLVLFVAVTGYSFFSFGGVTFDQGFVQVDMMNFYNAQLAKQSASEKIAISNGWHLWSLLRGIGFLFITFEMISLAFQLCVQQQVSSRRTRLLRWSLGILFLLLDGLAKFLLLDEVRTRLFENLL